VTGLTVRYLGTVAVAPSHMSLLRIVGLAVAAALATGVLALEPAAGAPASSRLPSALVGTWDSAEGAAEIIYVFRSDGTYKHAGVLMQERASGTFSFTIGARGTVTVRGRSLVLHPRSGTQTLHDPDDSSRDFRQPISRTPERYRWSISGYGRGARLTLTDQTGNAVTYHRL
jgi:hypothetical protein